ncbi:MAG: hypothetical protein IPL24_05395 [Bacteroidetes bacterium]|nr:hypothetical protein [Bacteroidota bacterium]
MMQCQAANRTVVAPVSLPQQVNFTGFTGSKLTAVFPNWYEAQGATTPAGTTSGWTNTTLSGTTTSKINLYSNLKVDWMVGPKFTAASSTVLEFKIAITDFASTAADPSGMQGTDDQVIVKISTDCGATWSNLQVYNAANTVSITNTLVTQSISLASYAGQDIMIAFFASEGVDDLPDYDFHIDDINIAATCSGSPTAGTASASPAGPFCGTAASTLSVAGASADIGISYQWQSSATSGSGYANVSGATITSLAISGVTTTTYYVLAVTCSNGPTTVLSNEVAIVVNAAPTAAISPSSSDLCTGSSATLTSTPSGSGETYLWSPGAATTAAVSVSPVSNTTYTVTVTSANGCTGSATAALTVRPVPTSVSASASASLVCAGGTVDLTSSAVSGETSTSTIATTDFESGLPAGWSVINGGSGNDWTATSSPSGSAHSGTSVMQYLYNSANAANSWLFTEGYALNGGTTYTITYWELTSGSFLKDLKLQLEQQLRLRLKQLHFRILVVTQRVHIL